MTIYYLYIKTHKNTGLKYLGQTSKNPYTYKGSGIDWKQHLKIHGDDHDTEIILQTDNWKQLTDSGRYYSRYYNIVGAQDDFGNKIWANKISESGGGGGNGPSSHSEETKNLMRVIQKQSNSDPLVKLKHKISAYQAYKNPEYKNKISGKNNHKYDHTIYKFIHISGLEEICTRQELIKKYDLESRLLHRILKRIRKSHKGWAISDK
jgi:hypothetical protein